MSNPNDPSKHLSEFLEPYRALAPVERLVAVAYGVVFPHSLTRAQMGRVLGRAGFRQGRRTIGYETYKASCAAPLEADILFETGNRGRLVGSGRWAPWLTSEAFRQGRLDRIEKAFRDLHPRYWGLSSADATMILRNRAAAGRFDGLSRELGDIDPVEWAWLTLPGGADVLGRLPGRFVDAAFTGCFAELVRTASPPEPILEAYAESEADRGALAAEVALFEVVRGAFDDALAVFAELPGDERESKRGRTGLASVRALVAALRGDDAEAVRRIDEAVACEKAGTRKRNVFPAHGAFALSLLALVRDHAPAHAAKLEHLLRVARKLDAKPAFVGLIEVADHIRGGGELSPRRPFGDADLNILVDGLLSCWTRDFPDRAGGERFATLLRFGAKAARNGYHWLAAESFEVCTRWWRNDGREEIEVRSMIAHLVGDESASPPELGAAMHGELGTRTLASLIRPVAEWEHALRRIEQVAHETRGKAGKRKRAPAAAMRRLAWVIEADDFGRPAPKPREQRGFKNGKWSKGRVISLKRLREQAGKMDFLADRDRAAAGRIVQNTDRWNGLPAYYLPAAGLFELAGHPYVFNAAGDPVEVVRRDPELLVQERDGALLVRVEPHAGAAGRGSYHARSASETRIEVTRFSKGHRKLCDVVPESGMRLPVEARERVVGAVSALAGEIRVQGLIADAPDAATQVDGDPRPWVRLEPSGPGLVATLAVEPVPDSGAYFQPGAGGTTTFRYRRRESRAGAARPRGRDRSRAGADPGLPHALGRRTGPVALNPRAGRLPRAGRPARRRRRPLPVAQGPALQGRGPRGHERATAGGEVRRGLVQRRGLPRSGREPRARPSRALRADRPEPGVAVRAGGRGRLRLSHGVVPAPAGGPAQPVGSQREEAPPHPWPVRAVSPGLLRGHAVGRRRGMVRSAPQVPGSPFVRAPGSRNFAGRTATLPGGRLSLACAPRPLGHRCVPRR